MLEVIDQDNIKNFPEDYYTTQFLMLASELELSDIEREGFVAALHAYYLWREVGTCCSRRSSSLFLIPRLRKIS